jgi:CDP-glucose 4,6-dehydratase
VLITGHTGFKGGWLATVLMNWDAEVIGLSLAPESDAMGRPLISPT